MRSCALDNSLERLGIVLILAYLAGLAALLLYILIVIWPVSSPEEPASQPSGGAQQQVNPQKPPEPTDVTLFGVTWKMWDEERLMILVMTAGHLAA